MATRRPRLTGAVPPNDGNETHAAPAQGIDRDDLSDDVQSVLAQLGEAASMCVVYRMDVAKVGKWDYVARIPAGEFSHEYLKEQFGGGEYKIVIIDAQQGPLNAVFTSIDSRFVGKMFATVAAAPVVAGGDPFKDQLLQLLLVRVLTPPPAPAQSSHDSLEMALRIAAVFKDGNGGGNAMEQLKTTIETATMLADRMGPQPEGLAGVAASFVPILDKLTSHAAPVAPVRRALPASTPVTPLPVPHPAPNPPLAPSFVAGTITPAWLSPFKSVVPVLVSLADGGANATMYADVALDQIGNSETLFAAAHESMNAGRMQAELFALAPALQQTEKRKAFAAELVAAVEAGLRQMIADEEQASNG